MFTPKIPVNVQPTGETIPLTGTVVEHHDPAATAIHYVSPPPAPAAPARPTVQLTPGALLLAVGGGTAAVLVVGAVLVSMLLAVAITAGSLAIVALVTRSILTQERKR
ncbi:SpdD-like protein [Streptomyces antnestii]|uniref:SpdD-like protein n=1 Tax=Streptomyces antnestii TaxID=2494256 RepID=A0A437PY81_9ACTN|nr:SpdD-like protein [Streptomyces sp. San01]RVU27190.1 SpdD-like protein [Streptomyces sp. San01]